MVSAICLLEICNLVHHHRILEPAFYEVTACKNACKLMYKSFEDNCVLFRKKAKITENLKIQKYEKLKIQTVKKKSNKIQKFHCTKNHRILEWKSVEKCSKRLFCNIENCTLASLRYLKLATYDIKTLTYIFVMSAKIVRTSIHKKRSLPEWVYCVEDWL